MAGIFQPQARPMSAPMPNAAAPRGAGPFSNLFSPDSPSPILATLGHAMGNPSREEIRAQELGGARGSVLNSLSEGMNRGRTPQQALLDLMSTEEGIDYFAKGGDVKTLVDYMASATPEVADPMNVAAGGAVYVPGQGEVYRNPGLPPDPQVMSAGQSLVGPGGDVLHSVPTTEDQNFEALVADAALTPQEKRDVARTMLQAQKTGDLTEAEAATQRMVDAGTMTPGMRDMILSGVVGYKLDPTTDNLIPFDLRNIAPAGFNLSGQVAPQGSVPGTGAGTGPLMGQPAPTAPQAAAPAPGAVSPPVAFDPMQTGEIEPDLPQPQGEIDWTNMDPADISSDNAIIINGAGALRTVQGRLGQLAGIADPALAAPIVSAMRNAMQVIKIKAGDTGLRAGNRLSADLKNFDRLTDYEGVFPGNYGANLLQLHGIIDREIRIGERIANNPSSSSEIRKAAEANLHALISLKASMPPEEDLRNEIERISGSEGQLNEVLPNKAQKAIGDIETELGIPSNSKGEAQTGGSLDFKTVDDAVKAIKEGKVKNGDTVTIGGRVRKIQFEE